MDNQRAAAAFRAVSKMIADVEKKLADAIEREDWIQAAEKDAYLAGLRQALIVFEQALL